ncbi:MAG: 4Fe-4S binding protein [Gracilibacteraceae bacterium]|jgi:NAD-dependent dihydropyrimidine dehydrogenase PreA subunit|nr:4Fe-4S binding protein [Gracilibacteraceae bacterium]
MYVILIDDEKCTGCGNCVEICPNEYLGLDGSVAVIKGDECLGCESCVVDCAAEAITLQEY